MKKNLLPLLLPLPPSSHCFAIQTTNDEMIYPEPSAFRVNILICLHDARFFSLFPRCFNIFYRPVAGRSVARWFLGARSDCRSIRDGGQHGEEWRRVEEETHEWRVNCVCVRCVDLRRGDDQKRRQQQQHHHHLVFHRELLNMFSNHLLGSARSLTRLRLLHQARGCLPLLQVLLFYSTDASAAASTAADAC